MLNYQSVTTSQRPLKEAVDRYMSPTCRPAWWHTQIRPAAGRQAVVSRPGAHLFLTKAEAVLSDSQAKVFRKP